MLFSYKYINHSMEKMQEYIDYIFFHIWCIAPDHNFEEALFDDEPDLKEIYTTLHNNDIKSADFFIGGIKRIFYIFKDLSADDIEQLQIWYQSNNNIECLCNNDNQINAITYSDIAKTNLKLSETLESFFTNLYSSDFLELKVIKDKMGSIADHYKEFVKTNSIGKCPFCGLYDIDSEYDKTRDAYDHFFPKSKYPFSSINFKNLSPMCYKCNSSNKGTKDPLHDAKGNKRKSFYAYCAEGHSISIKIELKSADIQNLKPEDIDISYEPNEYLEEINTWIDLFGIDDRYKAKCCSIEARFWVSEIIDDCRDLSPEEYLHIRLETAQTAPYLERNFLRIPFLRACEEKHIFA